MLKELLTCILPALILLPVAGCQDDLPDKQEGTKGKETVTLTFTAEPGRMVQTKSEVRPAASGSEAEKAGFSYEMVVTSIDSTSQATKAIPASFKNATALLFTSAGAFNGRATIGNFQGGMPLTVTFTGVTTTNTTGCRMVLVADDEASTVNLANNTALTSFTGTYSTFISESGPSINQENKVTKDTDIPYVGSITGVNLSGSTGTANAISLYRMLGKMTVSTPGLNVPGATLGGIWLYNAQNRYVRFGTPNNYDGSGSEEINLNSSADLNYQRRNLAKDSTVTFYGGEILKKCSAISFEERNFFRLSTYNAPFILLRLDFESYNTNISIGEEYQSTPYITFFVYLGNGEVSDFSFRRNHVYDVTVNINGTRKEFLARSVNDRRIKTSQSGTDPMADHAGLCVGRLGGFVASASGANLSDVEGDYTKMLLLEPNNPREIGVTDSKTYAWNTSPGSEPIQPDACRLWDYNYIKKLSGQGGMSNVSGSVYNYCNSLTLGGVAAGSWYVPTVKQLSAIEALLAGMQENPVFGYYSAFDTTSYYWSSSEQGATNAWFVGFHNGTLNNNHKRNSYRVRCVRDL